LEDFLQTPDKRRASIPPKKTPGGENKWKNIKQYELENEIGSIEKLAYIRRLLYISFKCMSYQDRTNNEIGFEPIGSKSKEVRSTSIRIPGGERILYDWHGSKKPYKNIFAVFDTSQQSRNQNIWKSIKSLNNTKTKYKINFRKQN